jgi:hypothetical protein
MSCGPDFVQLVLRAARARASLATEAHTECDTVSALGALLAAAQQGAWSCLREAHKCVAQLGVVL